MKYVSLLAQYRLAHALSIIFVLGLGTVGWAHWPLSPRQELLAQQQRWSQRPFANYRITLQIQSLDKLCHQEVVAHDEHVQAVLADTCNISWLAGMTVSELFDVDEQIERSASMHCYPSERFCTCRRFCISLP